jgi:hypothetical protein
MRALRKVGIVLATVMVSIGLIGITVPAAEADSSWGFRIRHSDTP